MKKILKVIKLVLKDNKVEFTILALIFFLFLCFGNVNNVEASSSYTELTYIESTGTQYIDTGVYAASDVEFEIFYNHTNVSSSDPFSVVIGGRESYKYESFMFFNMFSSNLNNKAFWFSSDESTFNSSYTHYQVDTVLEYKNNLLILSSEQGRDVYTNNISTSFEGRCPLALFGSLRGREGVAFEFATQMRLYYCKIWKSGELVRNFIPCLDESGVVCLYDDVSHTFFYNEGTGSFIGGEEVITESALPVLELGISNSELTNDTVKISTRNFPEDLLGLYKVKYSYSGVVSSDGSEVWFDCELEPYTWQFVTYAKNNDTYKFAYFDIDTDEQISGAPISSVSVTNLLGNFENNILIEKPRLSASLEVSEDDNTIIAWVETQTFSYEANNYISYFWIEGQSSGDKNDINNWTRVDANEFSEGSVRQKNYRCPVYDNTRVYCMFSSPDKGGYSDVVFIDIDIDAMYQEYLEGIEDENKSNPIVDFIVRIFVPKEMYFTELFSLVNTFFGETFGVLYFPIEVVLDFLNRFYEALTLDDGTAVIDVSEFKFMGVTLIPAFTYDFYDLLENETFKLVHDIYLVMVDVIIVIMLLLLAKNTFAEIVGSRTVDDGIGRVVEHEVQEYKKSKKVPMGFRKGK